MVFTRFVVFFRNKYSVNHLIRKAKYMCLTVAELVIKADRQEWNYTLQKNSIFILNVLDIAKARLPGVLESRFVAVKTTLIGKCINENCCVNRWAVSGIFLASSPAEMKGNSKSYVNPAAILMYQGCTPTWRIHTELCKVLRCSSTNFWSFEKHVQTGLRLQEVSYLVIFYNTTYDTEIKSCHQG